MKVKCPICSGEPQTQYKPFCSRRCADLDLARWLRGSYAIPGESVEPPTDDENAIH